MASGKASAGECTITLASSESKRGRRCDSRQGSHRRARRARTGGSKRVSVPPLSPAVGVIVSRLMRACTACRAAPGCPAGSRPSLRSVAPPAISNWIRTRSSPVTSSVTVCSTCRRGLASMKAKAVLRVARHQEFDGAEIAVVGAPAASVEAACVEQLLRRPAEGAGGCDLDDLLALPLQAAVAVPDATGAPCRRRAICTSTWRACSMSRSDIDIADCRTLAAASDWQRAKASSSSSPRRTSRMPRPPPPATALIIIARRRLALQEGLRLREADGAGAARRAAARRSARPAPAPRPCRRKASSGFGRRADKGEAGLGARRARKPRSRSGSRSPDGWRRTASRARWRSIWRRRDRPRAARPSRAAASSAAAHAATPRRPRKRRPPTADAHIRRASARSGWRSRRDWRSGSCSPSRKARHAETSWLEIRSSDKLRRARTEEADRQHDDDHRPGDEDEDAGRAEFAEQKRR